MKSIKILESIRSDFVLKFGNDPHVNSLCTFFINEFKTRTEFKTVNFLDLEETVNIIFNCDIKSKSRKQNHVFGRFAFSAYLRDHSNNTLSEIGGYLKKNHATIIHYLKENRNMMTNKYYSERYEKLILQMGNDEKTI